MKAASDLFYQEGVQSVGIDRIIAESGVAKMSLYNCTWCQKRTGSALGVSVYFLKENVEFSQGTMGRYRLTSDAGRWIEQEFCQNCGTVRPWTLEFLPAV